MMDSQPNIVKRTVLNVTYHILALPLGVAYFSVLVTLIATGASLVIVWIGIPILLVALAVWWWMALFERWLANTMLMANIPRMIRTQPASSALRSKLWAHLKTPVTWKCLAYLFIKFPYGIVTFTISVALVALSAGLIAAPFLYPYVEYGDSGNPAWSIDTTREALVASLVGVVFAFITIPVINGLATLWRAFAQVMLGSVQPEEIPGVSTTALMFEAAPGIESSTASATTLIASAGTESETRPVSPAQIVVLALLPDDKPPANSKKSSPESATTSDVDLTDREREVLELVAAGLTNKAIAEALFVTEGTIKRHTHNIYRKLDVNNRTRAVLVARDQGLIDEELA